MLVKQREEAHRRDLQPGFFADLAHHRLARRTAHVAPATGQSPAAVGVLAHEQHSSGRIENQGAHVEVFGVG